MLGFVFSICGLALLAACDGAPSPKPLGALELTAPVTGYEPGALFSIWGSGPNDVWLVGGEQEKALVLRFDGTSWRTERPPVDQQLWWVHGFPGGPVFVAGDGGAIARWQDGVWEAMDTGHPGTVFYGIWGAAPDDMWAVGGPFVNAPVPVEAEGHVVLHYDGTAWTRVAIPALADLPDSAQKNLFKVWGSDADRVFIVGDGGLALHYDGVAWTRQDTGLAGVPLFTVVGRAADDVWAVGGLATSVLVHWNGQKWSEVELPRSAPPTLQGVWTAPGQPVVVSGHYGFVAQRVGSEWAVSAEVTDDALHGVWGDGQGTVWASGGNIATFSPDYRGTVLVAGRSVPSP